MIVLKYAYRKFQQFQKGRRSKKMLQLQALFSKMPAPDASKVLVPTAPSASVTPGPYSALQAQVEENNKLWIDPK